VLPALLAVILKVTEHHDPGPPTHRIGVGGEVQFVDHGAIITGRLPAPLNDSQVAEAERDLVTAGAPPVVAFGLFHIDASKADAGWTGSGRLFGVTTSTGEQTVCVPVGELFNGLVGNLHADDPGKSGQDAQFAERFNSSLLAPERGQSGVVLCAVIGPEYRGQTGYGPPLSADAHIEAVIY